MPGTLNLTKRMIRPHHAYQGETSGRMRVVLGLSLLLAVCALVGLAVLWREAHQPSAMPTSPPVTSARMDTAPQAPSNEAPQNAPEER